VRSHKTQAFNGNDKKSLTPATAAIYRGKVVTGFIVLVQGPPFNRGKKWRVVYGEGQAETPRDLGSR
jgi:hypothetical protein